MRSEFPRRVVAVVLGVAMLGSTALLLFAQSPATQPADPPAQAPEAPEPQAPHADAPGVDPREIFMEIQAAATEMQAALSSPDVVTDPQKREEAAPKVLPPLKRMIAGATKLEQIPEMREQAKQMQMQFQVMAATFGDEEAQQALQLAARADGDEGAQGQAALLLVDWFRSNKDADTQNEILDRAQKLADANPESDTVTEILMAMTQIGAANDAIEDRAEKIATGMKSQAAQQARMQAEARAKLDAVEGQPITITGTTVDGKPFSTADWKGKVILVDFWATWCGPCIAELPRVKQVYDQYHDKGLEILGVSNDHTAEALKTFMQRNPDMPWPQLFDVDAAAKGDWHPVTMAYGIEGIPTMFLIDRKGVVRTVEARENFEELIPKLLAETE